MNSAPTPDHESVFLEPQYADGLPYDTTAGGAPGDEDDDLEAA